MHHPILNYVARQPLHLALVSYRIHLLTVDIARSIALNLKHKCIYNSTTKINSISRQWGPLWGLQWRISEAYSKPYDESKMVCFAKIVNRFQPLTFSAKHAILDVWPDSEHASAFAILSNIYNGGFLKNISATCVSQNSKYIPRLLLSQLLILDQVKSLHEIIILRFKKVYFKNNYLS